MMEIRITSGDYKGRYIGLPVGNSGGANLAKKNTPVNMPGTRYGLYAQEKAATSSTRGGPRNCRCPDMAIVF